MKLRIEVDEMGRHVLVLHPEIVEEFQLEDGDSVNIEFPDDEIMEVHF